MDAVSTKLKSSLSLKRLVLEISLYVLQTYVRAMSTSFLGKVPSECGACQHFCFSCN